MIAYSKLGLYERFHGRCLPHLRSTLLGILKVVEDTMLIAGRCSPTSCLCSPNPLDPNIQLLKTECGPQQNFTPIWPSIAHAEAFPYLLSF